MLLYLDDFLGTTPLDSTSTPALRFFGVDKQHRGDTLTWV